MNKKEKIPKEKKVKEQSPSTADSAMAAKIAILAALAIVTVVAWIFTNDIFGSASVFNEDRFDNDNLNYIYQKIPALIRSIQIIFLSWVCYIILVTVPHKLADKTKTFATAVKLISSFIKYAIFIIAVLLILSAWGVDTTTLLVSAGILGLIIGLGAQSLIADIIAGLFIVFDGEFKVGDIVVIDGWRGTVREIGMRTTQVEDVGGNIKIFNNSSITAIVNQTQELSVAQSICGIDYDESLQRVELIIRDNLPRIKAAIPQIVDGPFYKGVCALNDSSVDLLFMSKCKEEDLYIVQRAQNREIKLIFDENHVNIPFPQVTLGYREPAHNDTVTKREEREADQFVEDQREASKAVEEDSNA